MRVPLVFLILLFLPLQVQALNLGLGAAHYAEVLEFYHERPRPELLQPMLRVFTESGQLARGEKRMFVAAFLATLVRSGKISLKDLFPDPANHDQLMTLAWSSHLAGENAEEILKELPGPARDQIRNSPAELEKWNPAWESSVLGMYWGAFMASGNRKWLARIIDTALQEPVTPMAQKAAASLYDYAPGHVAVQEELRKRLARAAPAARRRIELILEHAARD